MDTFTLLDRIESKTAQFFIDALSLTIKFEKNPAVKSMLQDIVDDLGEHKEDLYHTNSDDRTAILEKVKNALEAISGAKIPDSAYMSNYINYKALTDKEFTECQELVKLYSILKHISKIESSKPRQMIESINYVLEHEKQNSVKKLLNEIKQDLGDNKDT